MESSIAVFLVRWCACEQPPTTPSRADLAGRPPLAQRLLAILQAMLSTLTQHPTPPSARAPNHALAKHERCWAPPRARKKSRSHIDAYLSRQPLLKSERLVRYEVNAVMPNNRRP